MGEHATMLMLLDKLDEAVKGVEIAAADGFSEMQRLHRAVRLKLAVTRVREAYLAAYAATSAKAEETGPVTEFRPSDTW